MNSTIKIQFQIPPTHLSVVIPAGELEAGEEAGRQDRQPRGGVHPQPLDLPHVRELAGLRSLRPPVLARKGMELPGRFLQLRQLKVFSKPLKISSKKASTLYY